MEFRVLGVLEALDEGLPISLGGPKQRSVLAMLLLDANRAISTDRLVDGLWGDDPPLRAAATLQVYVSNLRKALEPDRTVERAAPIQRVHHSAFARITSSRRGQVGSDGGHAVASGRVDRRRAGDRLRASGGSAFAVVTPARHVADDRAYLLSSSGSVRGCVPSHGSVRPSGVRRWVRVVRRAVRE
jgi:hypothetical protein